MPAGRGDDEERYEAYGTPPGADAAEELAHELALAAALDRSRSSLSPDRQASVRMKQRLFAALAEEGFGPGGGVDTMAPPAAPSPGPTETTAEMAPVAGPRPDGGTGGTDAPTTVAGVSVGAGGTRTLTSAGAGTDVPRGRKPRHVLPSDHPDQPNRPGGARGSRRPGGRPSLRKRVALVSGAALLALVAIAGGGALVARNALPGDALYAMKRASESTGTVFTFSDDALGHRHLDLAATRLGEIRQMVADGSPDPVLVGAALEQFRDSATAGSVTLLGDGAPTSTELGDLRTWTTGQAAVMREISPSLPAANRSDIEQSYALLNAMNQRAEALRARTGCSEVVAGADELGAVPASAACVPTSATVADPSGGSEQQTRRTTTQSSQAGTTTDQDGTTTPAPEGTTTTPPTGTPTEEQGDLLDVLPGDGRLGVDGAAGSAETAAPDAAGGSADPTTSSTTTPPPLLPPITLPPLLPGLLGG
ncbi:DUF5667 domain-containing protein [Pseudonocardia sp. T1-2H]|uniref:DUF5667 domain-containing protein n=1 Tax=Pseudonocardia sp. T1-2H TaxID=3128899 RepID=UPI003100DBF9